MPPIDTSANAFRTVAAGSLDHASFLALLQYIATSPHGSALWGGHCDPEHAPLYPSSHRQLGGSAQVIRKTNTSVEQFCSGVSSHGLRLSEPVEG